MEISIVGDVNGGSEVLSIDSSLSNTPLSIDTVSKPGYSATIVFRGRGTAAAYTSALRSLYYTNEEGSPLPGVRYITFSIFDGITSSNTIFGYTLLNLSIANQPPFISTSGTDDTYQTTYFPNMDPILVLNPELSYIQDYDSPRLLSAEMRLSNTEDGLSEWLEVTYRSPEHLSLPVIAQATNVNEPFGRLFDNRLVSSISNVIFISDESGVVGDVEVIVDIRHSWVGDIKIELEHGGRTVALSRSPGGRRCARDDVYRTVFDEDTSGSSQLEKSGNLPGLCKFRSDGVFSPVGHLRSFSGMNISGEWRLIVTDLVLEDDNGRLANWALVIQPQEEHLLVTTPPVIPLLTTGSEHGNQEHHKKWVESDGRISDISVHVQLAYPHTQETLHTPTLVLIHPDGTEVHLSNSKDTFCAFGNYTYLIFDDRNNQTEKQQYQDSCPPPSGTNSTNSTTTNPIIGTTLVSGDTIMGIDVNTVVSVLEAFDLGLTLSDAVRERPDYPTKSSLVDLLVPIRPLSQLHSKTVNGAWTLRISSEIKEVTLLGWSLRISREPNIDYLYNSTSQILSFYGPDSSSNYQTVLKSVIYQDSELKPKFGSTRRVEMTVSDGITSANVSLPSSLTLIRIHHIEIDLDPGNVSMANFPNFETSFTEMGQLLNIADQGAVLMDFVYSSSLYELTITILGYANIGSEGIAVYLNETEFGGMISTDVDVSNDSYLLILTSLEEVPIKAFETILRTSEYYNFAEELEGDNRTILVQARDLVHGDYFVSFTARSEIDFVFVNDAPVLILNSEIHTDSYSNIVNFIEGEGPVALVNESLLVLYDHDHDYLVSVSIHIQNPYDGKDDTLLIETDGTSVVSFYNATTNTLLLSGVDSIENYTRVLSTIRYNNLKHTPGNPDTRPRNISFVPDDGTTKGKPVFAIVTFNSINDPTIVDLNGNELGVNNSVIFVEEGGPIRINPRATIFDIDNDKLAFIEIVILNPLDGVDEYLQVKNVSYTIKNGPTLLQEFHILHRSTYDPSNATLRIEMSGDDSLSSFESILRTLTYNNLADEPAVTSRWVRVIANDGIVNGPAAYVSILIEPVNDSPYFKPGSSGAFEPQMFEDEEDLINDGFLLDYVISLIGDDDEDSEGGVAIIGVDTLNGYWQYSISGGEWAMIPANVSAQFALHLSNAIGNKFRFVPNLHFYGNTTISFIAWDTTNAEISHHLNVTIEDFDIDMADSNITALNLTNTFITTLDGHFGSAESRSDIDPYSNTTLVVTLEVIPVNDAPLIDNITIYMSAIMEDDASSSGDPIALLLSFAYDYDPDNSQGIAIIDADQANGTWQYTDDGGLTWRDVGEPSLDQALVIASVPENRYWIRFRPHQDFNGVVSLSYLAWDMTDGTASGSSVDTTLFMEDFRSYSFENGTAVIEILPVNDSPVILSGMTLDSIQEDTLPILNHGTPVWQIISGYYNDVDDNAMKGVAVIAVDERFGNWQYTCESTYPIQWRDFIGDIIYNVTLPKLPTADKATLLLDSCLIRFLPDENFNTEYDLDGYIRPSGDKPYLKVRGWDNTGATMGRSGTYGNDATYATHSTTNEYSHTTEQVYIDVISINDIPVLHLYNATFSSYAVTFIEDGAPVSIIGDELTLIDQDHARLIDVNITLYGSYGTSDGYLNISSSQFSSGPESNDTMVPNKPPRVFNNTFLEMYCDGQIERREQLLIDVTDTDLAFEVTSYCPFSIQIYPNESLGLNTIHKAQFEKVLRTLKYENRIEEPAGGVRIVEFLVSDGVGLSITARTTVNVLIINDAPMLDLNKYVPDINNFVVYSEGSGPLHLVNDTGLVIIDYDDNYLQYARIELTNHPDGGNESLNANLTGTTLKMTYENFTLTISGNATIGVYNEVLTSVTYDNKYSNPGNPDESIRLVEFYLSDGSKESVVAVTSISFLGVNDAPYLDINGALSGVDSVVEFREEQGPVRLVDQSVIVHDEDNTTLAFVTAEILFVEDVGLEFLEVSNVTISSVLERNNQNTPELYQVRNIIPMVSYNITSGQLNISGLDSLMDYAEILKTITYNNLADEPTLLNRTVVFILNDGDLESSEVYATVIMTPINDSPRFNNHPIIQPFMFEDQPDNGVSIYDVAYDLIEDDDETDEVADNDIRGIAIIDADLSNGEWQFQVRGNSSMWHTVHEDIGIERGILLRATADNFVRFLPNQDFYGNTTLKFVAWDASDGLPDGAERMALSENDTNAFSFEMRTLTLEVRPVNDAPVLNTSIEPRMTSILEDSVAEWPTNGDDVSLFLVALITDVDVDPPAEELGIAIINTETLNGIWQYSIDGGATWSNISTSVAEDNALVLTSLPIDQNRVRFFPNKDFNGEVMFSFKIWDLTDNLTSGTAGIDTRTDATVGPYSTESTTAHLTVEPVNDSPVISGNTSLSSFSEDTTINLNLGDFISSILDSVFMDVDRDTEEGLAVTGIDLRFGFWEYTCDPIGVSQWYKFIGDNVFGQIAPRTPLPQRATLLDATCRIRFQPSEHFNTEYDLNGFQRPPSDTPFITFKGWDRTKGSSLEIGVDTTSDPDDHTNAFSKDIFYATVTITPVNDPPVISVGQDMKTFTTIFTEPVPPERTIYPVKVVNMDTFYLVDPDNVLLSNLRVVLRRFDNELEYLTLDTANTDLMYTNVSNDDEFTLEISLNGSEFGNIDDFRVLLTTIQYQNEAEEPSPGNRTVTFTVTDSGLGGNSRLTDTTVTTIEIQLVNDPPELDLNLLVPDTYTFVSYVEGEASVPLVNSSFSLIDFDSPVLSHAVVKIMSAPDMQAELLHVNTSTTNITFSYDNGTLELLGPASVDDFYQVLSTVAYSNNLSNPGNPNDSGRTIKFVVNDGQDDSIPAYAYLAFTAVNNRPFLDVNGDSTGTTFANTFFEERGPIRAVDANLFLTDIDNDTLAFIEVTITNPLDSTHEVLSVTEVTELHGDVESGHYEVWVFSPVQSYNSTTNTLTITGLESVYEYQQVLKTLIYDNTADEPSNETRILEFVVSDGMLLSNSVFARIDVVNINDSPFFSKEQITHSAVIYEDIIDDANPGFSLEEIIGHLIFDDDRDSKKGIAIIQADSEFGVWEFTSNFISTTYSDRNITGIINNTGLNNDSFNDQDVITIFSAIWLPVPASVSQRTAVVVELNGEASRIRFVPYKDFNGNVSVSFVAWDLSDGIKDGTINVDATDVSPIDPYSNTSRTLTVQVMEVNDAPVLSAITFNLSKILEDDTMSVGDAVDILVTGVTDVDKLDTEFGVAIVGADEALGRWEFSLNGGENWTQMSSPSEKKAVLLKSTPIGQNRIRFVPVADFNGFVTVTFRAWDLSSGEPSGTMGVDATNTDEVTGPFSVASTTATLFVEPVNDSPVLFDNSSLHYIFEDISKSDNNGTLIEDIVNQTFFDIDADTILNYQPYADVGVAVVGVDLRFGVWQWLCPGGTWATFIGDVYYGRIIPLNPRVEKATLLGSGCRIRFLPNQQFNTEKDIRGDPRPVTDLPAITIRAWDNTGISAGLSGTYGQDTTYNIDSALNEFSAETSNATIFVSSRNDLSQLQISTTNDGLTFFTEFIEDSPYVSIVDTNAVRITDIDHSRLESVQIVLENPFDASREYIDIMEIANLSSSLDINDTIVTVWKENQSYNFQLIYEVYDGLSGLESSSLLIMAPPGVPPVNIEGYEALLAHLVYRNLAPEPTNTTRNITFLVNDSEDVNSMVKTFVSIKLRAENHPDLRTNLYTTDFTENDPSPIPAVSPNLTLTDRDHNEYFFITSAIIWFSILPNSPNESLSVDLSVVQASFLVSQVYDPDSGTLRIGGSAPVSQYEALLKTTVYHNTELEPRPGAQYVYFKVTDMHGLDSNVEVLRINIFVVNDQSPVVMAPLEPYSFTEGSAYTRLTNITVSDPDSGNLPLYQITLQITNPFDLLDEVLHARQFGNLTVNYANFTLNIFGPGPVVDFQRVLSTVTYSNLAEEPDTTPRTVVVTAEDESFESEQAVLLIDFVLVNDRPVIDLNGPDVPDRDIVVNYVEGDGPESIVDSLFLTVTDNDHLFLTNVTVNLTNPLDTPLEVLAVDNNETNITAEYDSQAGILQLYGEASLLEYQTVLRSLTYENKEALPGMPSTTPRIVTFIAFDGREFSLEAVSMVTFDSVNDPPIFDLNGDGFGHNFVTNFTEEGPPVALTDVNMTLFDVDNTSLSSLTVTISNRLDGDSEILSLRSDITSVSSKGEVTFVDGVLHISGLGEVELYEEVASLIQYQNTADEPDFTMRTITFTANDGLLESQEYTTTVNLLPVNDPPRLQIELDIGNMPPVIIAPQDPFIFVEGSPFVHLTGVTVSDQFTSKFPLRLITVLITNPFDLLNDILSAQPYGNLNVEFANFTLTIDGHGSIGDFQRVLSTLRYTNLAKGPDTTPRIVEIIAQDENFESDPMSVLVDIKLQDRRPIVDLNGPGVPGTDVVVTYIEGNGSQSILDQFPLSLSNRRSDVLLNIEITLTNPSNMSLELLDVDITVNGSNITAEYDNITGALELLGEAPVAEYEAVLRTLTYELVDNTSSYEPRLITIVAFDGNQFSLEAVSMVTFDSVNDPPLFDLNGDGFGYNFVTDFTENGPPVALTDVNMTLFDVDNTSLSSLTVTISNRLDGESEILSLRSDITSVSSKGEVTFVDGVLHISGLGEVELYEEVASLIQYQNTADEPDFTMRTITFTANDGLLESQEYTTTINLIDLEKIPVIGPPPYNPTMLIVEYVENDPPVQLVNPEAVLVQDDDDAFLVAIHISMAGVLDSGFEAVFFHESFISAELADKVEPYNFKDCPIEQEHYTNFTVPKDFSTPFSNFTLEEVESLIKSLHYCNSDEFSTTGIRNVTFVLEDKEGGYSDPQMTIINVTSVNDNPFIREDVFLETLRMIDEDSNYSIPALSYFADYEEELNASSLVIVLQPEKGRAEINESGHLLFVSHPNDYGTRIIFYKVCDSEGLCSETLNLTIEIMPIDDFPYANHPLILETLEDNTITVNFTQFFGDYEDDLVLGSTYPKVKNILSAPITGSWEVNDDLTTFTFTPVENRHYIDQFKITVCDSANQCVNLTVNITILPVNDLPGIEILYPSTSPNAFFTSEDTPLRLPIEVTDIEDRDYIDVDFVSANHGTASVDLTDFQAELISIFDLYKQSLHILYEPDLHFYGEDTVTVSATDSEGGYSEANISIIVEYVNDPPVFGIVNVTVLEDTILRLRLPDDLQVVDPEDELNAASFSIVTLPEGGELKYEYNEIDPPPSAGTLVYEPSEHNYTILSSPIRFTLMACDRDASNKLCTNATIYVNIKSVNDAPLLPVINLDVKEDQITSLLLTDHIRDVEEGTVATGNIMILFPLAQNGVVQYNNDTGVLTYTPNENYFGGDRIYYQACDLVGYCNRSGMILVTVHSINDPPVAESFTIAAPEDEYDLFAIYEHISDIETPPVEVISQLQIRIVDPISHDYVDRWISQEGAILRVFDAHGIIGYEPTTQFVGIDRFSYSVCDICDARRNTELGRVDLGPDCLLQIEGNNGSVLQSQNNRTHIACTEASVKVIVQNVDDVPVVSDISDSTSIGQSVILSPFEEAITQSDVDPELSIYSNSSSPIYDPDDYQLEKILQSGLNIADFNLYEDSDIDELSLSVHNPPKSGQVAINSSSRLPFFVYTPNDFFQGYDEFVFEICDKVRENVTVQHCDSATARIHVFGEGPMISSLEVIGKTDTTGRDTDSKISRGDIFRVTFATPTNTPPTNKEMGEDLTRDEVDRLFRFYPPFISPNITEVGYVGRWINNTVFEIEIIDEGYPQPELIVGKWRLYTAENPGPCEGFDPVTRQPVEKDPYCLLSADETSKPSRSESGPLVGDFGKKIPEVAEVKVGLDVTGQRISQDNIVHKNSLIVVYLKEPFTHYQLKTYCNFEAKELFDPTKLGNTAGVSLSGCQNIMPDAADAEKVYASNIETYVSSFGDPTRPRRSTPVRERRQSGVVTELPVYSEITFKVVSLDTPSKKPLDDPQGFMEDIRNAIKYQVIAEVVSNSTGVPVTDYLNYRDDTGTDPFTQSILIEYPDVNTPNILNVTGVSDNDMFDKGDSIRITFDRSTNTPPVASKADIDLIFIFDPPQLGAADYIGQWIDDTTVEITITTTGDIPIFNGDLQLSISFTSNHQGNIETPVPAEKPWCVGTNVCSVPENPQSVGVCNKEELSCRAFKPWTGIKFIEVGGIVIDEGTDTSVIIAISVVVILLVIFAVCIALVVCVVYRQYKKKKSRSQALKVVEKWKKDKLAPGKDDKEGTKTWTRPPDVPIMRANPDPFSSGQDEPPSGIAAGNDPFRTLGGIRPPTAQPSENLPPIPPQNFMPRGSPKISPRGFHEEDPIAMSHRPVITPLVSLFH